MCSCHLCYKWQSGTNLTMSVAQPKIIQMLRELGPRVINRCKLQVCNKISQIDNNLFVIRSTRFYWLINKLINLRFKGIVKFKNILPSYCKHIKLHIFSNNNCFFLF